MSLEITRASDLVEQEQRWLIRDLLPQGTCGMLAGAPKQGKTFVALGLAASVATGRSFLGKQVEETGKALYVAGEDTETTVKTRLGDAAAFVDVSFDALRIDTQSGIEDLADAARGYSLVILDPLVSFHRLSENSAGPIVAMLAGLRGISRMTQATIMLVHHTKKESSNSGSSGQSMRGSSVFHGWLEFGLYLGGGKLDVELRMAPSWSAEWAVEDKDLKPKKGPWPTGEVEGHRNFGTRIGDTWTFKLGSNG